MFVHNPRFVAETIFKAIAKSKNATSAQIALACLLKRSHVIIPIPGTSTVTHLEENMSAHDVTFTDKEFDMLCSLNIDGTDKAPTKWRGY
jgi:aryl-alcohol dehydrogenase-like predicted oxidoreductase